MPKDGRRLATPPGESTTCEASQSKLMQDEFGESYNDENTFASICSGHVGRGGLYKVEADVF